MLCGSGVWKLEFGDRDFPLNWFQLDYSKAIKLVLPATIGGGLWMKYPPDRGRSSQIKLEVATDRGFHSSLYRYRHLASYCEARLPEIQHVIRKLQLNHSHQSRGRQDIVVHRNVHAVEF